MYTVSVIFHRVMVSVRVMVMVSVNNIENKEAVAICSYGLSLRCESLTPATGYRSKGSDLKSSLFMLGLLGQFSTQTQSHSDDILLHNTTGCLFCV